MSAFFAFSAALPSSGRRYRLAAGLFFLALALVYYWPSLGWLPRGIHEWAQADRLALAISYYDHGLQFFRPRTLNLSSLDGIVGVEFPLVPYLAAAGAKILGRAAIVPLYRALTSAAAGLAYYYLFRLVFERTGHFVAALVPGLFLAASPTFAYYAGNFLPDPVGASLVVVGTYYLVRYSGSQRFGHLAAALGVLTLATLIKLSAGIYLGAALGTTLLWGYLQPLAFTLRQRWLLLLLASASLGVVVGYTLYTYYLNETYHAWIFMTSLRPIDSWAQYDTLLRRVQREWSSEYLSSFQYQLLLGSLFICLFSLRRIVRTEGLWVAQLGVASVGIAFFLRLLGAQLADHDYYVVATFGPGVGLLVALATTQLALRLGRSPRWLVSLLFGGVLLGLLLPGLRHYRARMGDSYRTFSDYYTYRWMQGGAAQLAAARVPPAATVLVLAAEAPNLSLVYFDRRGQVWNVAPRYVSAHEIAQRMAADNLDYLIIPQPAFAAALPQHADLLTVFRPVVRTAQFVVLQRPQALRHW
ncbi:MAG: glycosyltransferase family 39 protein [Janthinobacterium lividum]